MSCFSLFHPHKRRSKVFCRKKKRTGPTGPTGPTGQTGQTGQTGPPGPGATPSYFSAINPNNTNILSDPNFHQTPLAPLTGTSDITFTAPSQVTVSQTGDYLVGYSLTIDGVFQGAVGVFYARVTVGVSPLETFFLETTNSVNNNYNSASSQNIIPLNAGDVVQFQVQYFGSQSVNISDVRFFLEKVSN